MRAAAAHAGQTQVRPPHLCQELRWRNASPAPGPARSTQVHASQRLQFHLSRLKLLPGKSEQADSRPRSQRLDLVFYVKGHAAPKATALLQLLRWRCWRQWLVCTGCDTSREDQRHKRTRGTFAALAQGAVSAVHELLLFKREISGKRLWGGLRRLHGPRSTHTPHIWRTR